MKCFLTDPYYYTDNWARSEKDISVDRKFLVLEYMCITCQILKFRAEQGSLSFDYCHVK